jgi:hypothetical protein
VKDFGLDVFPKILREEHHDKDEIVIIIHRHEHGVRYS